MMAATATELPSTVAATWPFSTALRETFITLNRLMMPFVMSEFTDTAVPANP